MCFVGATVVATDPTDRDAIRKIYPKLAEQRDFTLHQDGTLDQWKIVNTNKNYPRPTAQQLTDAKAQITAAKAQVETVRAGLLQILATLPPGEQALYSPVHAAVKLKLDFGDLEGAKSIIATAPAPTTTLQSAQAAMLALFPAP